MAIVHELVRCAVRLALSKISYYISDKPPSFVRWESTFKMQLSQSGQGSLLRCAVCCGGRETDVALSRKKVWIVYGKTTYMARRETSVVRHRTATRQPSTSLRMWCNRQMEWSARMCRYRCWHLKHYHHPFGLFRLHNAHHCLAHPTYLLPLGLCSKAIFRFCGTSVLCECSPHRFV